MQAQRDLHASIAPILRALRGYVTSHVADTQNAGEPLSDFGLTPRKLTKLSVDAKATAAAKNRATRAARHTMGKDQRKEVKGEIPSTTAPATPPSAGTTSPAASTSGPTAPTGGSTTPVTPRAP